MQDETSVMKHEKFLPEDFNGTFMFSNPTDEDFIGTWGQKQYLFPAMSTVPMVMLDNSPIEIQHIRKKFAKDLAGREFYKSKQYKMLAGQEGTSGNRNFSGIHQAATYTLKDLEPYIQACLTPLPVAQLTSKEMKKLSKETEEKIHMNDDGTPSSEAVAANANLRKKALE